MKREPVETTVTDGTVTLGSIAWRQGAFEARSVDGVKLGKFATQREAERAIYEAMRPGRLK